MSHLSRAFVAAAVVSGVAVGVASPSAHADDDEWGPLVPGEYLVELKPGATVATVAAAAGALEPVDLLVADGRFLRLVLDPTADPNATLAALRNTEGVERAQPNLVLGTADALGTRRKFFGDLLAAEITGSSAGYHAAQPGLGHSGLPAGGTGAGVRVAVVDTGVDLDHPGLAPRLATGGYDFVDHDPDPSEVANGSDDNGNGVIDEAFGHGTYVAGVIGLVAPAAEILPVRVLDDDGSGSTWTVMQGIAWAAAQEADIVNLSLGGARGGPLMDEQLKQVEAAGVVVVAAAGNDARTEAVYPAAGEGVVGVSAIDGTTGAAATFSNRGSWIDVAAPGVGIVSLYPDGLYARWGGTSAAAPVVAGALARVVEQSPGAAADDLVSHLTSTAVNHELGDLSAYGRIDVGAAVARAGG